MDRRFLKPGWLFGHLLVVAAFLVCCRLGVWQWHRTHDADGTLQNLSYAILWPAFGIAFIYMWVRFLMLEKAKDLSDDQEMNDGLAAILADGVGPVRIDSGDEVGPSSGECSVPADGADDPADGTAGDDPGRTADDSPGGSTERPAVVDVRTDDDAGQDVEDDAAVFVGTVEDVDDEDDPELAAYNRALAALAERDERRGR